MPFSTSQIINNRYRVVRRLKQGGFGAVYRVWDINLDRPLALKENLETSPDAQRQFKREAQMLFDVSHPNLPKVIDTFNLPGQGQYLVMEFVEGEDLEQMLERLDGPLDEVSALGWVKQVCEALEHLHSRTPPIIHRDIKPANIKITPTGKAMLVDFGIAKAYDPHNRTTAGAKAVTPGYSPQEQYGAGVTDARTDIYALGATLYHLLTGQAPPESIMRNLDAQLKPPREVIPAISPQSEAAILKAMQMRPSARYQTMAEFNAALPGAPPAAAATPTYPQPLPEGRGELLQATAPTQIAAAPVQSPASVAPVQAVLPVSPPRPVPVRPAKPKGAGWWRWLLILAGLAAIAVVAWFLVGRPGFGQPTAAPTQPAKVAAIPTRTPPPPKPTATPIPAPPSIADLTLDGANVILYDRFDTLADSRWKYSSVVHHPEGMAQMVGRSDWSSNLCLVRFLSPGNAIALRYRFKPGSEFEFFIETGDWGEPNLRRFGQYGGTNPYTNIWSGPDKIFDEPLPGVWQPKPDTWLELLIAMDQNGKFSLLTRNQATPNLTRRYEKIFDNSWKKPIWRFCAGANSGLIHIDDFYLLKFTDFK
jgi:serine/threonine protein kinase